MYAWDKSLEVGNQLIDDQHKHLIEALNSFLKVREDKRPFQELRKSLDFLNDYTIKHFFDEERLQKKYEYPDYENHKKLHEICKKNVRDLQIRLIMKGASDELFNDIKTLVGDWLVAHIKTQDSRIGAYLKSKGID
ncbi:MAG: hemerythrin family protein [Treponema sp.]|jgi:hemerythrin|nr:hemerythrin family protein [Treponema sp.]